MKTVLKKMHRVKSYDQNNLRSLRKAISFVFWARQEPQSEFPEEALPSGVQSSSLYFWNQHNQENGGSLQANLKSNFYFFWPPLVLVPTQSGPYDRGSVEEREITVLKVRDQHQDEALVRDQHKEEVPVRDQHQALVREQQQEEALVHGQQQDKALARGQHQGEALVCDQHRTVKILAVHTSSLCACTHVPNVIHKDVIVGAVNVLVVIINELRSYLPF